MCHLPNVCSVMSKQTWPARPKLTKRLTQYNIKLLNVHSERDHAARDRSEVERLEAQRFRDGCTAWRKTQSSDLTVAVKTGSEQNADLKASFVQLGATSVPIRTKIRDLVGCVTTTKELGSEIQSLGQNPAEASCRT